MKKLADYINNQYISLAGLDEEVIEKLSNLDGQIINECCGCCPCGDYACEEPCSSCSCDVPCECPSTTLPAPSLPIDHVAMFREKFAGMPKVYDLLDIHTTFDYRLRFEKEFRRSMTEPILINDYTCPINQYDRCDKLHDDIISLCDEFNFLWPVVMIKGNGDIQFFGAKKFGSNGKEGSIKSSLIDAANILTKLEKKKEIQWAQVLDVSIDNLDDLYDFLFTVTFNKEKYDKEVEAKKAEDFKKLSGVPVINTIG